MPIDYHRLVDGMSEATRMVNAGAAGLSVIDVLLTGLRDATGATGATFIEFGPEDGRVIVGNGAMTWSTGQPVVNEALEREELGMWWHDTRVLPGRIGELLPRRGMTGCVGHAVRVDGPSYGSINLFFSEIDPLGWALLEPAMRVTSVAVARVYAPPPPATPAGPEEDDRTLFLAVAGHELRTPVTVIKGFAGMLADRWESLSEGNRRGGVQVISQRADQLARLVDRMLGASVGDGAVGRLVRVVPFDSLDAIGQAVRVLPADLRAAVQLDLPVRLPPAYGDPAMVGPILAELVNNAVRHTPGPGAGTAAAQLELPAAAVEIQAGADAQTVYLRVCDRGLGIDPAYVERAFERFWRAPDSDPRTGVGLGLYLVRRMVERQHGWVSLRPREGGGTVAEVRLPRADAVVGSTPPVPPPARPSASADSALQEQSAPAGA
jgi:two-component system, OmpR family, phosphate regulon sensor histidine kinase PhoR